MKKSDFVALPASLPYVDCIGTFLEISKNDDGEVCVSVGGYSESINAIKFDDVKTTWYGSTFPNQVRSCDALYVDSGQYFLIEFKTGQPKNVDIHRKIYDSVIGLMEHGVLSMGDCRERLQYLIVSRQYADVSEDSLQGYLEAGMPEPWDYVLDRKEIKNWDKNDIRKLTNFLFAKVFKLSLADFDRFAKNRNWSN